MGSTATIIAIRYRNYGIEPDAQTAMLLTGALLSDTQNLKSNQTTDADRELLKILAEKGGIKDIDGFFTEMFKASISYEGKSDEEIFLSDYREYESSGKKFGIAVVNAYDEESARNLAGRMKAIMPSILSAAGMDLGMAQVSIFHDDISITYLVPADEYTAAVIEEAFEGKFDFDGTSYIFKPGFSRRQVLVPAISEVLEAHPNEN